MVSVKKKTRKGEAMQQSSAAVSESSFRTKHHRREWICHLKFLAGAVVFILIASHFIFEPVPVMLSNGVLGPIDATGKIIPGVVRTGDRVALSWDTNWVRRCPLKFVPVIIDSSRSTREFKDPAGKVQFTVTPPSTLGFQRSEPREFVMPPVVGPVGEYYATIYPQCWYDLFLNRSYVTPPVEFKIATTKGNAK